MCLLGAAEKGYVIKYTWAKYSNFPHTRHLQSLTQLWRLFYWFPGRTRQCQDQPPPGPTVPVDMSPAHSFRWKLVILPGPRPAEDRGETQWMGDSGQWAQHGPDTGQALQSRWQLKVVISVYFILHKSFYRNSRPLLFRSHTPYRESPLQEGHETLHIYHSIEGSPTQTVSCQYLSSLIHLWH